MGNEMARDGTRLALFIDGAIEPQPKEAAD